MFGEKIEQMKRDYTDKYVLVDESRPELARFRDVVGRVKTVNMNGRALVEFDDYHLNVGWYDIAPEYLKVVDKPPPRDKTKKAAPKADAKTAAGKAAPPAGKGGKMSVADMLAAARSGGSVKAGGAAPTPAKAKAAAAAAKPAGRAADRSKMSVADMLAAARAGGAAGAAPKAEAAPGAEKAEKASDAAVAAKKPAAAAKSAEKVDKSKMSIDDMVNWCREHDTK